MKYTYYIACLDQTFGDADYGRDLKDIYLSLAGDFFTIEKGKKVVHCSRFCGTSRYDTPDGIKTVVILKDFFNAKPEAYAVVEAKQIPKLNQTP